MKNMAHYFLTTETSILFRKRDPATCGKPIVLITNQVLLVKPTFMGKLLFKECSTKVSC